MNTLDLEHYLEIAVNTARAAGAFLLDHFETPHQVEYKGAIDPVTEADKGSEKLIVDRLTRLTPETDILAEEGAGKMSGNALCWVVDPLDATVNFSHNMPVFCVSIGLEFHGEPVVGVVYDPKYNELFTATRDREARLNNAPIHVSKTPVLDRALLATGFPYDKRTNPENNLDNFCKIALLCQGVRRVGSAALDLCWSAAGRYDGYWELSLSPWDISAGRLIVEKAGGKVTDFEGNPIDSHTRYICATNGKIHKELTTALTFKKK